MRTKFLIVLAAPAEIDKLVREHIDGDGTPLDGVYPFTSERSVRKAYKSMKARTNTHVTLLQVTPVVDVEGKLPPISKPSRRDPMCISGHVPDCDCG